MSTTTMDSADLVSLLQLLPETDPVEVGSIQAVPTCERSDHCLFLMTYFYTICKYTCL